MKRKIFKVAVMVYLISLLISPWLHNLYMDILVLEYGWKSIPLLTFIVALTAIFSGFSLIILDAEGNNNYDND